MEILLASGNKHKKLEISEILNNHTIILPSEAGIDFEFEETGNTYFRNAYGKAEHLFKLTGKPVLADDSGLSVPALNGEPGVFSARYGCKEAGRELSAEEKNTLLLKNMEGIHARNAFFVACMVLILDDYRFSSIQETFKGEIALSPYGKGGFGYDPVFFLKEYGKTAAELSSAEKNRISHRGKAGAGIKALLDKL